MDFISVFSNINHMYSCMSVNIFMGMFKHFNGYLKRFISSCRYSIKSNHIHPFYLSMPILPTEHVKMEIISKGYCCHIHVIMDDVFHINSFCNSSLSLGFASFMDSSIYLIPSIPLNVVSSYHRSFL